MGAFTLTNGALLGGLALLAAPIVAHLLQRRARKPIVFPSIAFLQATAAQHSRLHKLRRLLLMLLRLLAVACIVLAFTRPVWWSIGVKASDRKAASATVLVMDQSLSTGQRSHGGIVFDRARAEVLRILGGLETGVDVAGLVWASDHSTAVFPRLTANLPALESEIASARPGEGRADFAGAIGLAARLLDGHNGPRRVVLLTDRQASNWRSPQMDDAALRLPAGIEVSIPELSVATEPNVSLSSPAMQPARPRPDAEVELTAAVRNHSDSTRVVNLQAEWLAASPMPIESRSVSLDRGQSNAITLASIAPEGVAAVRWQIQEADALAGDNSLWLTAETGRGIPMVIASDDSPDDAGTAAFYLMRALAPFDEQSESQSSFAPRHVAASRLTADDLAEVRVLFLAYAGVMKQETAAAIVQFVERGGGLVVLAGDGPADRNVEALQEASKGGMIPWSLLARIESPRRSPMVIDRGRWNSRWLREFDEPSQLALREIGFRRVWQAGTPSPDAETLLSFANGGPACGLKHFGKGQCLLLNFSPESTISDLGKTGTFVALIQMLTSQLADDDRKPSTRVVGERLMFDIPQGMTGSVSVLSPDGSSWPVALTTGTGELVGPRATRSGIHRLTADGQEIAAVAVNVDPRESDLSALTVEELQRLVSSAGAPSTEVSPSQGTATDLDAGKPLWGGFLLTGLFAVASELFLLGLWRR